jgi:hypothetical protein
MHHQQPDLSEEEAIRRAMEESELLKLGLWDGLGAQLQTSRRVTAPPRHLLHQLRPSLK